MEEETRNSFGIDYYLKSFYLLTEFLKLVESLKTEMAENVSDYENDILYQLLRSLGWNTEYVLNELVVRLKKPDSE